MKDLSYTGWQKSSYSNSSANCVEVAFAATPRAHDPGVAGTLDAAMSVGVRDSKQHGNGPVLQFSADAWTTFLARTKAVGPGR
jgi:hypothetical protein